MSMTEAERRIKLIVAVLDDGSYTAQEKVDIRWLADLALAQIRAQGQEPVAKKVVCHANGDRCPGCDHYWGKADVCKYADETQEQEVKP